VIARINAKYRQKTVQFKAGLAGIQAVTM
jgi:hypothetical protein